MMLAMRESPTGGRSLIEIVAEELSAVRRLNAARPGIIKLSPDARDFNVIDPRQLSPIRTAAHHVHVPGQEARPGLLRQGPHHSRPHQAKGL